MNRRNIRYQVRYQKVQERAVRNMSAIQRQGKKEAFLRGIGQGLVFLIIGSVILVLNIQKVGAQSVIAALPQIPLWVWVLGGGAGLFGLYWMLRNLWQLLSVFKANEHIGGTE